MFDCRVVEELGILRGPLTGKITLAAAAVKELVPKRGLEPPLPDGNYTLNVARLPIPPLRQIKTDSIAAASQ